MMLLLLCVSLAAFALLLVACLLRLPKQHSSADKVEQPQPSGSEGVSLDLNDAQRAMLMQARKVYLDAGGVLDELWEPFLLRFVVAHGWIMSSEAVAQLQRTARWRESSGARAIKDRIREGQLRFVDLHSVMATLQVCWFTPYQHSSYGGDIVSYLFLGTLDIPAWLKMITDEECEASLDSNPRTSSCIRLSQPHQAYPPCCVCSS